MGPLAGKPERDIDQDIHLTKGFVRFRKQAIDFVWFGDITVDTDRLSPKLLDLFNGLFSPVVVYISYHDIGAKLCECNRHNVTKAAIRSAAGDNGDFSSHIEEFLIH
jgi:hypothetical protein